MNSRPKVVLRDLHFRTRHYFDYLATGLALLAGSGEIEFRCEPQIATRLLSWRRAPGLLRRIAPPVEAALARTNTWCASGEVAVGDRTVRFAFDVDDTPFGFRLDKLETADLYFKCQHPIRIDESGFPLSSRLRVPFDPEVLSQRGKIRPAMLGRPLSRTLNLRKNIRILEGWERLAETRKTVSMLAYFGSDRAPGGSGSPNEAGILDRYRGTLSHPNLKRGQVVAWLKANFPERLDARVIQTDRKEIRGPGVSDREHERLVARSMFNLNISGYRRSIPFRFSDSFLAGTSNVTDELAIKWYHPFEAGVDVIEIGRLGYELPEHADWEGARTVLSDLMAAADERYAAIRPALRDNYRRYWHPTALAKYVVRECLSVA